MHILIAPNAFKHSLDAEDAAAAIQQGLMNSRLDCQCECFPIGDGGDGTAKLINKKCKGTIVDMIVSDPLGRSINTTFGLIDQEHTAVIEMADASGLRLLNNEQLNPLRASSYGTGEQIKRALDKGVKKIIIGMGGSATVDGGTGMLRALGIRFLNAAGEELTSPQELVHLDRVDASNLDERIKDCEVVVLCDVNNLLLGSNGAAAIFGPQKGASVQDVHTLDKSLSILSEVASRSTGKDMSTVTYGGTAGGAAAGLYAFLNARLVNGIEYFLDLTNFDASLEIADLLITGEGSIDEQTLQGKGPFGVASRAKQKGVPVIGVAGKLPLQKSSLQHYFDVLLSIGNEPMDLHTALKYTNQNLVSVAKEIGNMLALQKTV